MSPSRKRLLVLVGLVLVLLGLLLYGFFPQEPLRRLVERRLREALGPRARIGALHLVPATLTAVASDVSVETAAYSLEIERLVVDLSAATLLGGSFSLDALHLERPRLFLRPSPERAAGGGPLLDRPLVARRVSLRDGELHLADPGLGGPVHLRGLGARGSLGEGALEITMEGGLWERRPEVRLAPARLVASLSPLLDLRLDAFEAGTPRSRVAASGSLGRIGAWAPDLDVRASVDLDEASTLAGTSPARGTLDVVARVGERDGRATAEATVSGADLLVAGRPVAKAQLRLEHAGTDTTASVHLALFGGRVEGEARAAGRATDGRLRAVSLDLAGLGAPLEGALSGDFSWRGDLDSALALRSRVTANGRAAGLALLALGDATGRFRPRDGHLDLVWNLATQFEGTAAEPAPGLRGGRIVLKGTARGPLPPRVDAVLEGTVGLASSAGEREVSLAGRLHVDGGETRVEARARGAGGLADVDLHATPGRPARLSASVQGVDLAAVVPEASGEARLTLDLTGPFERPSGRATLETAGLAWRGVSVGQARLEARARKGRGDFTLDVPALSVEGRGHLEPGPPRLLTVTLDLSQTPLDAFSPLLPADTRIEGRVEAAATARVPLTKPRDAVVDATVESLHLVSGRLEATTTQAFRVAWRDDRLALENLAVEGPGVTLRAGGTLGLGKAAGLDARIEADVDLARVPAPEGWSTAGDVRAALDLSGSVERPEVRGPVSFQAVSVEAPAAPPVRIAAGRLDLDGQGLAVEELTAALAGGAVTVSGRIPLPAVYPPARLQAQRLRVEEQARLDVAWRDLDVARLLEKARGGGAALPAASLSGRVRLEGGFASLAELRAAARVDATPLSIQDLDFRLEPAELTLEAGRLHMPDLTLNSRAGTFTAAGDVGLVDRSLDLTARGHVDLRALAPFLTDAALTGSAEVDLAVGGTFEAPQPRGRLEWRDATLRVRDVPQAVTGITGAITFDGTRVVVEPTQARLGGGALTLQGQASLGGDGLGDVQLSLMGRDMALRYPAGLRSRLDADLRLTGEPGAFLLSGDVRAQGGLYDLDVVFRQSLRAPTVRPLSSPFLRTFALDLRVETLSPIRVRNNVARLEAGGRLEFRGNMEAPLPSGRLDIQSGSILIQGREFDVKSGSLEYTGDWNPTVSNVEATAEFRNVREEGGYTQDYKVTMKASGRLAQPELKFDADPPGRLTDEEVLGLVATGQVPGGTAGGRVAGETSAALLGGDQAAALLTSGVTRGIASGLEDLGFDEVTIQPQLLARETEPGARFTFAKRFGAFRLLYSLSLNNPEQRFIELEAEARRGFKASVRRRDDGTFDYGVGQRLLWGGSRRPPAAAPKPPKLTAVRFEGDPPLADKDLRDGLDAREGRRVGEWDLQDDTDRIRERLVVLGHLEAEVSAVLDGTEAVFTVRAGPRYRWRVEGIESPPDLTKPIRTSLDEYEALERGAARLLRELHDRGHLRARVETRALEEGSGRTLLFSVTRGPVLSVSSVRFPGAAALSQDRLLRAAGGPAALLNAPDEARKGILAAYEEAHHRSASVEDPRVSEAAGRLSVEVPVHEGPRANLAAIRFEGASFPPEQLEGVLRLEPGGPFAEEPIVAAVERLRDFYYERGYASVQLVPSLVPTGPDLELLVGVREGPRLVLGSVVFKGLSRTKESFVRKQVELRPGDPVDPRDLARLEGQLLGLGVFSRVSVEASPENPSTVTIAVQEDAWLTGEYEFRYNDADKGTTVVDAEVSNLLGRGLALGGRYRLGKDVREGRGSLHLPFVGRSALTLTAFRLSEDSAAGRDPITQQPLTSVSLQRGFEVQQTQPLDDQWTLLVGYRFKRGTTTVTPDPTDVAGVEVSLLRDTRDNALDMRRGRFWSLSFEYSPEALGSDFTFVKGFAQVFVARPLGGSLTWAQGYRLGLAHAFGGQVVTFSERFRAGGGNTLRGFETNAVGPRDTLGDPRGGDAVVVLNQELRYRHGSGLGAVAFYDVGNVFAKVSEMSFDFRHTLGVGLRYASPVGLLRVDLGFPLGPREGEKGRQYHLSLGQAF